MYLTTEIKQELFSKHGHTKQATDTGSSESQIALYTHRINHLTQHLKMHPKDFSSRQGLLKLVGQRRSQLDHLQKVDITRYRAIIQELDLRK